MTGRRESELADRLRIRRAVRPPGRVEPVSVPLEAGDRFVAEFVENDPHPVFGGQLLGQTVLAAQATVDTGRQMHALQGTFVRAGRPELPVEYAVSPMHDGRSFAKRAVLATQGGKVLFHAMVSFAAPDEARDAIHAPAPAAPLPDGLPPRTDPGDPNWARLVEFRYVNLPPKGERPPTELLVWVRVPGGMAADEDMGPAVIAYLSDSCAADMLILLRNRTDHVSLNHALWLHRTVAADEWLLFVVTAEWSGSGRGLGRCCIFTAVGGLVASCTQEAVPVRTA